MDGERFGDLTEFSGSSIYYMKYKSCFAINILIEVDIRDA